MPQPAHDSFEALKKELEEAVLVTVNQSSPLVVETDASDVAISATLNQEGRPVAFFSRTLTSIDRNHSAVEKEAYAIVEAIRKWRHYLINSHFKLVTDQKSVAFIYDKKSSKGKIKNDKIQRWKIELSPFVYDVVYRPGPQNHAPDALSWCNVMQTGSLEKLLKLHESLCHPGLTRMSPFVRQKNLPYSVEEIKTMTSKCHTCAELKPRFYKDNLGTLIKATQPFDRLSMDFKGPIPSRSANKYLLTVIDEYSRFPFAFACPDRTSSTLINCLCQLFTLFGMPQYIHFDRCSAFMSEELKSFLHSKGVASSHTTAYNPRGNGQVERLNGSLWKTINLALESQGLPVNHWENVLLDSLHSMRSLLCTETNTTLHERLFLYQRKSTNGQSLPSWLLKPGPLLLKRNVRSSKYEPLVDEVDLVEANPQYAVVRLSDGRESTVSLRHLAPVAKTDKAGHGEHICKVDVNRDDAQGTQDTFPTFPGPVQEAPEGGPTSIGTEERQRAEPYIRMVPYNLRRGPK